MTGGRPVGWLLALLLSGLLPSGCGLVAGANVEDSPSLDQRLYDLTEDPAGAARLSELTDFAWDRVVVFTDIVDADAVNAVVGQRVLWWPNGQSDERGS